MSEARVVCATCKIEPKLLANEEGDHEAFCAVCQQRDKVDDALRIAGEHLAYESQRALQKGLTARTRGNKAVKFEAKRLFRQTFRWHLANS